MTASSQRPSELRPLPVSQPHIQFAPTTGDKHGYVIMKEIEALTEGAVAIGPGTLHGGVKQMLKAGPMEGSPERPDPTWECVRSRPRWHGWSCSAARPGRDGRTPFGFSAGLEQSLRRVMFLKKP